jgi:hypothetical protein
VSAVAANGRNARPKARRPKPRNARSPGRWPLGWTAGDPSPVSQAGSAIGARQYPEPAKKRWVTIVCPPGISRSKPQTPRAERRGFGGVAFNYTLRFDVVRHQSTRVQWDPAFRAPLLFGDRRNGLRRTRRRKEYGRRSYAQARSRASSAKCAGCLTIEASTTLNLHSSRRAR